MTNIYRCPICNADAVAIRIHDEFQLECSHGCELDFDSLPVELSKVSYSLEEAVDIWNRASVIMQENAA
jgi:hypothetical protein